MILFRLLDLAISLRCIFFWPLSDLWYTTRFIAFLKRNIFDTVTQPWLSQRLSPFLADIVTNGRLMKNQWGTNNKWVVILRFIAQ